MKKFLLFLGLICFFIAPGKSLALAPKSPIPEIEVITQFSSEITINQDTSLSITEKIVYFTPVDKHGIYRYIPEKYHLNGLIATNRVSDISVKDNFGVEMPYQMSQENGNVTLKIGDPNATFVGSRIYVISYKVDKAIMRQNGFDELYWDITGEGWQFPIEIAKVTIHSPFAPVTESKCFTGVVGATATDCLFGVGPDTIAFTTKPTKYGENFTVALKLDQNNSLAFPSSIENIIETIKNNWFLGLIFLPGLLMFVTWYKKGRDWRFLSPNVFNLDPDQPQGLRPLFESINTPMVYEPLKDLTPGEAGAMLDEKVDNSDIVAEIIELARKKYLKIERVEKKGFLQFGHDYLFTKLKESEKLVGVQEYLFGRIFQSGESVTLSKLKGSFYTHMAKAKEMINKDLKDRKLFTGNPNNVRGIWFIAAILLICLVFAISISDMGFLGAVWPFGIFFLSALAAVLFAWNMPQKTAVGTNLALQVKGLRETIRLGKWREEIKEKHLFIEEILPFAISLGVIGKLTKDMAGLNIEPPKYLAGGYIGSSHAWGGFVNDFSSSVSSGLSYNPSSSSRGGSGFSGGSSGGGGGGGGGGSW